MNNLIKILLFIVLIISYLLFSFGNSVQAAACTNGTSYTTSCGGGGCSSNQKYKCWCDGGSWGNCDCVFASACSSGGGGGGDPPPPPPADTSTPVPTATPVVPTATFTPTPTNRPTPSPTRTPTPSPSRTLTPTTGPTLTPSVPGDADGNGIVSFKDYFYFASFKSGAALPTFVKLDFDKNGLTNNADRSTLIQLLLPQL